MMIKQCGFREEPHGCYLHCTTQLKKKQELLDGAKLGYDFLNKHCFDILKDSISIYTVVGVLLVIVGLLLSRMNVNKNKVLFD